MVLLEIFLNYTNIKALHKRVSCKCETNLSKSQHSLYNNLISVGWNIIGL